LPAAEWSDAGSTNSNMSSMLKLNVPGAAPLMTLVVSVISPARNAIQQTMISPASQYLARLMRPSKRNKYQVQSIATSGPRAR
jgi:hypothetical protein